MIITLLKILPMHIVVEAELVQGTTMKWAMAFFEQLTFSNGINGRKMENISFLMIVLTSRKKLRRKLSE